MSDLAEGHLLDTDSESVIRSPEQLRPVSLIRRIFRRQEPVGTRTGRKRSGKDQLIGTNCAHITRNGNPNKDKDKRKRRHHEKEQSDSERKTTPLNNHHARNDKQSTVDVNVVSDSEISVTDDRGRSESFSVEDNFLTRVQTSSREAYSGDIGGSERSGRESRPIIIRGTTLHEIIRKHFRMLMFPTQTSITGYYVPKIPWMKLGMWLYLKKKRFINWPKTISFFEGNRLANIPASELGGLLFVDLVDWTRDEKKHSTADNLSLILDPKGRVLVKVGDLQRMYPGHNTSVLGYKQPFWFRGDEYGAEIQDETPSLTNAHSSASSASSRSTISSLKT